MAELKTKKNKLSVTKFLNSIADDQRRKDSFEVMELMKKITKEEPTMYGASIVGFGTYHYKYETGREADWFLVGFSPRKLNLTLYIMTGFSKYDSLMKKLGTHSTGKSCLYIKRLEDLDKKVLAELIKQSVDYISKKYK